MRKKWIVLSVVALLLSLLALNGGGFASLGAALSGEQFDTALQDYTQSSKLTRESNDRQWLNYASDKMKVLSGDSERGFLRVFGFAPGSSAGIFAGQFHPDKTPLTTNPTGIRFNGDHGWYIIVYSLALNVDGKNIYQVNLHDPGGTLQDDRMVFQRTASEDPTTNPNVKFLDGSTVPPAPPGSNP